jgi:hypothetical protein
MCSLPVRWAHDGMNLATGNGQVEVLEYLPLRYGTLKLLMLRLMFIWLKC